MTSSSGNIFGVTGPLCGEFTGLGEFPTQRPVTRSFDVFFDLRLNKRLSKQPRGWWFETPWWSLWRHCNDLKPFSQMFYNLYFSSLVDSFSFYSSWKTKLKSNSTFQKNKTIFNIYHFKVVSLYNRKQNKAFDSKDAVYDQCDRLFACL